jgi:pyruvate dehydrogenase E1 component
LGSGAILREVLTAADLLANEWGVTAEVWSATSFSELARDAREVERDNRLHPLQPERTSHLERCLPGPSPIIAVTDYARAWPQLIASYLAAPLCALGTDGFGRSDTRAALRSFFEIDHRHIVLAALTNLKGNKGIDANSCDKAIITFGLSPDSLPPWLA